MGNSLPRQLVRFQRQKKRKKDVSAALSEYALKEGVVAPKGYSLVIVAGMNYGKYVEDKGYNVLHLTKYFLREEMKKIFDEVTEMIKSDS
nr:MAG TPA: hypothetical protein [Caudoviricetes sp.]